MMDLAAGRANLGTEMDPDLQRRTLEHYMEILHQMHSIDVAEFEAAESQTKQPLTLRAGFARTRGDVHVGEVIARSSWGVDDRSLLRDVRAARTATSWLRRSIRGSMSWRRSSSRSPISVRALLWCRTFS